MPLSDSWQVQGGDFHNMSIEIVYLVYAKDILDNENGLSNYHKFHKY